MNTISTNTTTLGVIPLTASQVAVSNTTAEQYAIWSLAYPTWNNMAVLSGNDTIDLLIHRFEFFKLFDPTSVNLKSTWVSEGSISIEAAPLINSAIDNASVDTLNFRMFSTLDRPTFLYSFNIRGADNEATLTSGAYATTDGSRITGRLVNRSNPTIDYVTFGMLITPGKIELHMEVFGSAVVDHRVTAFNVDNSPKEYLEIGTQTTGQKMITTILIPTFEISGNINPPVSSYRTRVSAYNSEWKHVYTDENSAHASYSAISSNNENLFIMASQMPGPRWTNGKTVVLDEVIQPVDTISTPFYFKCTTAGATGAGEPIWNTAASGTTSDGTAVWTLVERLTQPVVIGPVTPTLIP